MARLTATEARELAARYHVPLDRDFHTFGTVTVTNIITAANAARYRKPANANGSRARYFHAYLVRAANRKESK
jgi:hypothetical protein